MDFGTLTLAQIQSLKPGQKFTERRGAPFISPSMGGVPVGKRTAEYRTQHQATADSFTARVERLIAQTEALGL
jgi:hypothetical protein